MLDDFESFLTEFFLPREEDIMRRICGCIIDADNAEVLVGLFVETAQTAIESFLAIVSCQKDGNWSGIHLPDMSEKKSFHCRVVLMRLYFFVISTRAFSASEVAREELSSKRLRDSERHCASPTGQRSAVCS